MVTEPTVRTADDVTASWFLGSLVTTRIASEDTDGAVSVLEHLLPPTYETPYHVHHNEDELSYLLEGGITLCTEQGTVTATAGETLIAPRGQPHGFQVTGDSPAKRLVFLVPAGYEAFFHEVGRPAETRRLPDSAEQDREQLSAIASDYDVEILGPLPEFDG